MLDEEFAVSSDVEQQDQQEEEDDGENEFEKSNNQTESLTDEEHYDQVILVKIFM